MSATRRATPPLLRDLNERTVLETIRAGSPISRAEISRRSGISKPTVSLALQSLLQAELVRETAERPDGPGYGAVYFEPVAEAAVVLGLDLGARFVRGAVCDLAGNVRARQDVELSVAEVAGAVEAIERLRTSLLAASGLDPDRVDGVVVGVPGVVETNTGVLRLAENVAGLEGRAFADELRSALGLSVTLENDTNLAALGEQWQGVARGVDDFVFLSVGTGMGAGLVLGGELHRGRNGAAGEIDFVFTGLDENVDPSGPQVLELAAEFAGARADARAVFGAAREGDERARAVVAEVARRIALHVATVAVRRRRRAGRPRRRHRRERRPATRSRRRPAHRVAAVPASCRGLDPRRGGRPDRRARDRPTVGARERLRQARAARRLALS